MLFLVAGHHADFGGSSLWLGLQLTRFSWALQVLRSWPSPTLPGISTPCTMELLFHGSTTHTLKGFALSYFFRSPTLAYRHVWSQFILD